MWWFRKRNELARRVAQAAAETDEARERLHRTREEVVKPLRKAARENRFAKMIRESFQQR